MFTHSASLYLASVLIWGSTWYAIKFQLGVVAPEVSLVYRFALAAVILLVFCALTRRSLKYSLQQHGFIALQGLFLFSSNYLVFYWATGLLTSGIVALMFSTVILMNIINGAIFLRAAVSLRVILGACFGIAGIASVFWAELGEIDNNADTWQGLWMCLLATWFASIGNIISARNQKNGIPVIQTNAWGMGYGALVMAIYAVFSGASFNYDPGFADKAAYSAVLFPVIALGISTIFENYQWSLRAVFGFALVLLGNYIVLTKSKR